LHNHKECFIASSTPKYNEGESVCWPFSTRYVDGPNYVSYSTGIPVRERFEETPCKTVEVDAGPHKLYGTGETIYLVQFSAKTTFKVTARIYTLDTNYPGLQFYSDANGDTVVELFRKDGTLRYRGRTKFGLNVTTSGQCFGPNGTPGILTNNARNCK